MSKTVLMNIAGAVICVFFTVFAQTQMWLGILLAVATGNALLAIVGAIDNSRPEITVHSMPMMPVAQFEESQAWKRN